VELHLDDCTNVKKLTFYVCAYIYIGHTPVRLRSKPYKWTTVLKSSATKDLRMDSTNCPKHVVHLTQYTFFIQDQGCVN